MQGVNNEIVYTVGDQLKDFLHELFINQSSYNYTDLTHSVASCICYKVSLFFVQIVSNPNYWLTDHPL